MRLRAVAGLDVMTSCLALVVTLLGRPAHASPPPRTKVVIEPGEGVPTDVVEALQFEIGQAGYGIAAEGDDTVGATVGVLVERERWRLHVDDELSGARLGAEGPLSDSPGTIALMAVELLVESSVRTTEAGGEPETEPTEVPAVEADEDAPRVGAPAETIPPETPRPSRLRASAESQSTSGWIVQTGVVGASLGPVGLSLGVAHDWRRARASLDIEGGYLVGPSDTRTDSGKLVIEGGGFGRTRLSAAYSFRPGKRVRPHLGGGVGLTFPVVRSHFRGEGIGVEGPEWGVVMTPDAEAGVSFSLSSKVALALGLRAGPSFRLAELPLANGENYPFRTWFVAGSLLMRFRVSR